MRLFCGSCCGCPVFSRRERGGGGETAAAAGIRIEVEVGVDFGQGAESYDVALYSEFESREDLLGYQEHPAHKAAVSFIREARTSRCVVDYEV